MGEWERNNPAGIDYLRSKWRLTVNFVFGPDAVGGEDWTDICNEVIPGYASLVTEQHSERLMARVAYLVKAQVSYQALLNDRVDMSGETPEAVAILKGDRRRQPDVGEWTSKFPLVLVDFGYQGNSYLDDTSDGLPRPSGEAVLWLDPANEMTVFTSMSHAGLVDIHDSLTAHHALPSTASANDQSEED